MPPGPFDTPSPREVSPSVNNRLATPPAERELTVHPAEGCVPVQYGGPLRVGGFPIYERRIGNFWFIDFALCEGTINSAAVFKCGDKTFSELGVISEVHLGVTGDMSSTFISSFDPTYTIPEYIAHVVCRFPVPNQTTGQYDPFTFSALVEGRVLYNPLTAATEFNGSPVSAAYDALTNTRYGGERPPSTLDATDWATMEAGCEFIVQVSPEIKRWEFALRVDQQAPLFDWVKVFLSYAHGHLRYVDGRMGGYLELARPLAQDNNGDVITFHDLDLTENTSAEITYVQKGVEETPTVFVTDYTDKQGAGTTAAYIAGSVQVPEIVTGDWIETHVSMLGFMTGEMAKRWTTTAYNIAQLDKDITIPAWQTATLPLVGERIRIGSRRLIAATDAPPNVDATPGFEEGVVTDIKLGDAPVLRAGLYRDVTYDDSPVIPPSPPEPPPDDPPDPDADPECPTDLAAPNTDQSEYGMIEFTPDPSPLVSYYKIWDLFPGSPVLVGTMDHTWPIGPDGKMHATFAALVHVDGTGTHLEVRVDSVSYAGNVSPGCATVDWDVASVAGACCTNEAMAAMFSIGAISSTGYDWLNYTKIDSITLPGSVTGDGLMTTIRGAADFLILPGNAAGIIAPVIPGWYHVTAGARWEDNATGFRALAIAYINGPGLLNRTLINTYITIDAGGSGYTTGSALIVTGGTLMTGGLPLVGTIGASGGVIVAVQWTGGLGYTAAPSISVAGGGSGATLTAHLPAAFVFGDINMDCHIGGGGYSRGKLVKEDIRQSVVETSTPTTNSDGIDMFFAAGSGLMLGVQQNSGGNLDLQDPTTATSAAGNPVGCRVSMFRISEVNGASDTNIICDVS